MRLSTSNGTAFALHESPAELAKQLAFAAKAMERALLTADADERREDALVAMLAPAGRVARVFMRAVKLGYVPDWPGTFALAFGEDQEWWGPTYPKLWRHFVAPWAVGT